MKKILALFLCAVSLLSFAACGKKPQRDAVVTLPSSETIAEVSIEPPATALPAEMVCQILKVGIYDDPYQGVKTSVASTLKNTGDKVIRYIAWDYAIFDEEQYLMKQTGKYEHGFVLNAKLKAGETMESTSKVFVPGKESGTPTYVTACVEYVEFYDDTRWDNPEHEHWKMNPESNLREFNDIP